MNKDNKKSYWPHAIIVFFLVVFTFNFWFLYQAIISNKGFIEEDTYEKGLNYQDVIDLRQKSKDLGIKVAYDISNPNFTIKLNNFGDIQNEIHAYKIVLIHLSAKGADTVLEGLIEDPTRIEIEIIKQIEFAKGQWLFKFYLINQNNENLFLFEDKFLN